MTRRAYRWAGWRTSLSGDTIAQRPHRAKPKGISNDQARQLAALQRTAGERYSGHGLSAAQASAEIGRLHAKLDG